MSQARQYELIYVVSSDATDQQIADLHTQVEEITGRYAGTLDKTENWGRRKLAYEIGPHKEGTYVLEVITGSGELMKEIDRRLRVSDQVIRHLTVRVDEEKTRIDAAVKRAADAAELFAKEDILAAMNRFNAAQVDEDQA